MAKNNSHIHSLVSRNKNKNVTIPKNAYNLCATNP